MVGSWWLHLCQIAPLLGLIRLRAFPRFEHFDEQADPHNLVFIPTPSSSSSGGFFQLFSTFGDRLQLVETFEASQDTAHTHLQDFAVIGLKRKSSQRYKPALPIHNERRQSGKLVNGSWRRHDSLLCFKRSESSKLQESSCATNRRRAWTCYNADIPFEKKPATSFYDTSEEQAHVEAAPVGLADSALSGEKRKPEEEEAEHKKRLKRGKEGENGPHQTKFVAVCDAQIQKLKEAESIGRRGKLMLPAAQWLVLLRVHYPHLVLVQCWCTPTRHYHP
ncbi:hypothetical protein EI94DRAFT_1907453 [Lactarius quietus]|nr:hypothetical protein EI94DRAFT_1907453 [Lactarius quietus]